MKATMLKEQKDLRNTFLLAVLLIGGIVSSVATLAATDSITDLSKASQAKASDLKDELETINAKIKAYKDIVTLKQRQGATLADQIEGLQAQADALELEINTTTKRIKDLESQIGDLSLRVAEKSLLIDRQRKVLAGLMRVYYADYSNDSTPVLLTSAESLLYFKSESWTADVSERTSDLLDSVKTLRDGLAQEQKQVSDKKGEVDALYQDLDAQSKNLEATKRNKAALLTKTQAEAEKYNGLVDDLQKQRDEIEQEINDLEAGKLGELNLDDMPGFSHGLLAYPLKKVKITQGYGKTSYSGHYSSGKHNGVDFGTPVGTPVLAPLGGKIVGVGNNGKYAYGKWIAIDHGNGMITLYGHLSSQSVSKGEKVTAGEKIGLSGNTGYSTGPHVHFSVFSSKTFELVQSKYVSSLWIPIGATVNPMNYLP